MRYFDTSVLDKSFTFTEKITSRALYPHSVTLIVLIFNSECSLTKATFKAVLQPVLKLLTEAKPLVS